MQIGTDDAQSMLADIQRIQERTRKIAAYAGTDSILIVWGIALFFGYIGTHLLDSLVRPENGGLYNNLVSLLWGVAILGGISATWFISSRREPVKTPVTKLLGWFWWALFAYAAVGLFLLHPFIRIEGLQQAHQFSKHMSGGILITVMFGYVVLGLWLDRFLAWIGIGLTALTVIGLVFLLPWFWLWMAFVGGGTLTGSGLAIRNRWR